MHDTHFWCTVTCAHVGVLGVDQGCGISSIIQSIHVQGLTPPYSTFINFDGPQPMTMRSTSASCNEKGFAGKNYVTSVAFTADVAFGSLDQPTTEYFGKDGQHASVRSLLKLNDVVQTKRTNGKRARYVFDPYLRKLTGRRALNYSNTSQKNTHLQVCVGDKTQIWKKTLGVIKKPAITSSCWSTHQAQQVRILRRTSCSLLNSMRNEQGNNVQSA